MNNYLKKYRIKNWTKIFACLIIGLFLLNSQHVVLAQESTTGPGDEEELSAFFDGAMDTSMHENHVPGAVLVVVKNGEILFSKGYGYADVDLKIPVDPETTLFRPGSVSKLFTWTAVMQLVEQGKLSLDEDINTYLDFKIPNTFPNPITLTNLMTHTPGFEDRGEGLFKLNSEEVMSLEDYLKTSLPVRVFPPGEIGAYSNYGTALAGYIVERVSKMDFETYVQINIFDPLGMKRATFQQPLSPAFEKNMSGGFNYVNGGYVKGDFEYVVGTPAGALSASGLDMAKFMIAHLQNGTYDGKRILKEETALQMHSQLYSPDARLDGMAYGFFYNVINDQKVLSHGGDTLLFHSYLGLLPDQNLGIFISTNAVNGNKVVSNVMNSFFDHYYPQKEQALTSVSDFDQRASTYAGSYILSRSNFSTMEKLITRLNPIMVLVNDENQVLFSYAGETDRFVETEPGLLVDSEDPANRMVLKEVRGKSHLFTGSPFVFIKSAWFDSLGLHALIFIGSSLLFLITLIVWSFSLIQGIKQKEKLKLPAIIGRFMAV
ncbi:MAG: serine hydrolase, partial [Anaerolineaceae bacterium]|nr:serine hydrolase [Anaerolineaceae bacterium]